ncbi:MAG: DNA methyltransferase [bacterium]
MNPSRPPLHAICPYFAMFPESFVREKVETYTKKGDLVFDPFCGRGTTILESLLLGRNAAGSDINPVAFCVSRAKADRPELIRVLSRINKLEEIYNRETPDPWEQERLLLPPFFRRAFYHTTLRELLFLRDSLNWHNNRIERFIAALILGSLHGEMDRSSAYFSNQMPRTICLKPNYSLRYWKKHELFPKKRDVFEMLRGKAAYRLHGIQNIASGEVKLADVRKVGSHFRSLWGKVVLVVTSPPYLNVTRYEEDQWLRLWFLGGPPHPTYGNISKDDRYVAATKYWEFLRDSWTGLAPLLKDSARVVIRLGAIGLNENEMSSQLKSSLRSVFPKARLLGHPKYTEIVGRQSQSFLPSSKGCMFEIDYVFSV